MAKNGIFISAEKRSVSSAEAAAIYIELGWGTAKEYSAARIARSLANCDIVVSARNEGGELVGVARVLSDFATTTKIVDMLIVPEYQHQGIGARMMKKIESLVAGTDIYGETERKNFRFLEGCGYKKRKGLMVFIKKVKR
ncbi:MAG: GNAT family N-acetyltransferase [Minisyncoccia bacterium]|jgi:GNAT superfamily N-acetyltransferase